MGEEKAKEITGVQVRILNNRGICSTCTYTYLCPSEITDLEVGDRVKLPSNYGETYGCVTMIFTLKSIIAKEG